MTDRILMLLAVSVDHFNDDEFESALLCLKEAIELIEHCK